VIDSALNAYAAGHFGPRDINWMHASYGLGAALGPLLVTALLASGSGWRLTMGSMSIVLAAIAVLLAAARHRWRVPALPAEEVPSERSRPSLRRTAILAGLAFTAVETGVESAAGIWGFVFLTSGRGLPVTAAGVAVSAYWAMMFAGRALLGPVAERAGASRVLAAAVACVPFGALLMALPGPGAVAVAGMMVLGLAAAPVFPLLTLTTADRAGLGGATQTVGLQVAASAVGSAAVPAAIGLVIGRSAPGRSARRCSCLRARCAPSTGWRCIRPPQTRVRGMLALASAEPGHPARAAGGEWLCTFGMN